MDQNSAFDWLSGARHGEGGNPDAMNAEALQASIDAQLNTARKYQAVFDTPEGTLVLDELYNKTQGAPLMEVSGSLVSGEVALSPADWAYVREGQNSVIRHIIEQIEFAKNPPQIQNQTEGNEHAET